MEKQFWLLVEMLELVMRQQKIFLNEVSLVMIYIKSFEKESFLDARIIIACRNLYKGREAVEKLLNETNCDKNQIVLMECDLSSFKSIRNFVNLYLNNERKLDILICNAGLGYSSNRMTEDGFDYVIQSNYLGHFLLTNLLLEKLKQSKPSRILNISSDLHQSSFF